LVSLTEIIIVSGASAVGKQTVLDILLQMRDDLTWSVSRTTRKPREGEQNGVHYWFIRHDEFSRLVVADDFLEWRHYDKESYGTPRPDPGVDRLLIECDIEGARLIKLHKRPEDRITTIVLFPPGDTRRKQLACLRRRHRNRGTAPEKINDRIEIAKGELDAAPEFYDHIVVNDDAKRAAQEISDIIDAAVRV
jgi:guanylate kinase